MKNLSKALALTLLLVPVVAHADEWCHGDNEHIWTYDSGQVPLTFLCLNGNSPTQAQNWAQTQCQTVWDNFASHYADDDDGFVPSVYFTTIDDGPWCRWNYRCRACVVGFLPHILLESQAQLGPADAGHAATQKVRGQVVSINLHGGFGPEPFYLVGIVTETGQVQVEVDAKTGGARIVEDEPEESCPQ